jgi:hypothetical protein
MANSYNHNIRKMHQRIVTLFYNDKYQQIIQFVEFFDFIHYYYELLLTFKGTYIIYDIKISI